MKTRLLGAAVLIALLVLIVPMLFSSTPPKSDTDQTVSLEIPPAPDRELQSRTLDVSPNGAASPAATPAQAVASQAAATQAPPATAPVAAPATTRTAPAAAVTPGSGSRLASVDIASRKPADALPEDFAPPAAKPAKPAPATPAPATPAATPAALPAGTAARGSYSINLSAYADRSKADAVVQKVRALGYPVSTAAMNQAGKSLTRVTAGPFETRAAAEAARLKITAAVPGAPASLSSKPEAQTADVPAPPKPAAAPAAAQQQAQAAAVPAAAPRAGGFAVQVAAVSSEAEATRLRDKLRGAGIAGYVDSIASSTGAKLWRVRAGPQTQRDDAVRLKDQIKAKVGLDGVVVSAP
ncbi:SPOR domain-containing protein [Luteibacter aegosomaticola]|uniref:SPOR domain-containing protein n=1 Tax=Luteibacter aegosomaticola TaxID=2911538 RepID=UPI001FF9460F|nr:SPOR domain-containing protein [Luteibacter aegosomaticola]UPG88695.1 SPOR domain-containing protein [Luteibacter aegosomaticola]